MTEAPKEELDPIEEAFSQAVVADPKGNATEAWRVTHPDSKANSKTTRERASKMMARHNVITRVQQIREELAERNEITLDVLSGRNEQIWHLASGRNADGTDKQIGADKKIDLTAMQKNVESQGKFHGILIDHSKITGDSIVNVICKTYGEDAKDE